jgi:hypothetical protein
MKDKRLVLIIIIIIISVSLRTLDITRHFAKRNGPKVLEKGPSISNKIDSNSMISGKKKEHLMKNGEKSTWHF